MSPAVLTHMRTTTRLPATQLPRTRMSGKAVMRRRGLAGTSGAGATERAGYERNRMALRRRLGAIREVLHNRGRAQDHRPLAIANSTGGRQRRELPRVPRVRRWGAIAPTRLGLFLRMYQLPVPTTCWASPDTTPGSTSAVRSGLSMAPCRTATLFSSSLPASRSCARQTPHLDTPPRCRGRGPRFESWI